MILPDNGMPALRCCSSRRAISCLACSIEISSPWRVYGSENESMIGIVGGVRKKETGMGGELMYWLRYLHKSSWKSQLGYSVSCPSEDSPPFPPPFAHPGQNPSIRLTVPYSLLERLWHAYQQFWSERDPAINHNSYTALTFNKVGLKSTQNMEEIVFEKIVD